VGIWVRKKRKMAELFIEIFSEEIPARMQVKAADDLRRLVTTGMSEQQLGFENATSHVTPRRIILKLDNVPEAQADVREERRGPKVGAPEKAVQGFLKSVGLTLDEAEVRNTPKGDFYFAVIEKKGRPSVDVLKEIVQKALENFPWPKSMRWGTNPTRWVRPLHSMICLLGGKVIPVEFAGKTASNKTIGHRFMAPSEIEVKDFADYEQKLRNAKVLINRDERRKIIYDGAVELAKKEGLELIEDVKLLEEVTGLIEFPVPLLGKIDDDFMDIPQEALISSMAEHQKYFSLKNKDGKMAPRFVVVANMETKDGGKAIVDGNERVLRARLSDGKFFWDNDRKSSLESRVPKLMDRIFHAKLGTDFNKVERIQKLAVELSSLVKGADKADVQRAALLCKADLTAEMVGEFSDLQGVMGRYYAINDNEKSEVAEAIAEHYSPVGPSDECPTAPVSVAVAMADKIDTLVGFWLIDQKPTGSKDPFALRRATLGVIRLIIENDLRVSLNDCFQKACDLYFEQAGEEMIKVIGLKTDTVAEKITSDVKAKWSAMQMDSLVRFFAERLKVYLKDKGYSHDLISSVFEKDGKLEDDLVRLLLRVKALKAFLKTDDGSNLLTAYRRAANIVRIEEKKDKAGYHEDVVTKLLEQEEEKVLFDSLTEVSSDSADKISNECFEEAMELLARLRAPVDAFFEHVTVNSDNKDLRANRLKLLSMIGKATSGVANFAKIES
jgi:glycyl-tRNA synthetase beta chain